MTAMKFLIFIAMTFSISAFANEPVIQCATNGYGIAKLTVEDPGIVSVTLSEEDDAPVFYFAVISGLKDLKTSTSATLIAQDLPTSQGLDNGKIYDHAVLLRIAEGKKHGFVAINGTVYKLLCF